jgi:hypothetical protein
LVKKSKKKDEEQPKKKKSELGAFLKKRAPIYLAVIAMLVIFVVPELTKGSLEKSFPELEENEQQIVNILMQYAGPNEEGLTVMDAISNKISDEYPDEKIYDHKKTVVDLSVSSVNSDEYNVILNFVSHKGEMNFDWNVNSVTEKITSNNPDSKHLIDIVDFYD